MAVIKPFKALRPVKDKVNLIASLPYDVVTYNEAKAIAKSNPFSFLHVDKAEVDVSDRHNIYTKSAETVP